MTSSLKTRPGEIYNIPVNTLAGQPTTLREFEGKTLLIVNVASRCGLTPHYAGLQRLHDTFSNRGFAVLGFPCNQFGAQEPGTPEEITEFCSTSYGVTFPLFEKIDVNGEGRHRIFQILTEIPDDQGRTGDVLWNFEKFVVSPAGEVVARFDPRTDPEDQKIFDVVMQNLPAKAK